MMGTKHLPLTDLNKFVAEVVKQDPEASLPCNMSDYWLEMIARDLEETVGMGEHVGDGSGQYAKAPLVLILRLLRAKASVEEIRIPLDTLHLYFRFLWLEINLEIVCRKTGQKAEAARLETIFSERDFWPKMEMSALS